MAKLLLYKLKAEKLTAEQKLKNAETKLDQNKLKIIELRQKLGKQQLKVKSAPYF